MHLFNPFKVLLTRNLLIEGNINIFVSKQVVGVTMSKFVFEGERNPGDGSRHPLGKKIKRAIFNLKAGLSSNKAETNETIHHISRAKK